MNCAQCGKALTRDEEGLSRKLINRGTKVFYCLDQINRTDRETLLGMIERFRQAGCTLFL